MGAAATTDHRLAFQKLLSDHPSSTEGVRGCDKLENIPYCFWTQVAKLLLVEDDPELAEEVRDWLLHEKYIVDVAPTGNQALAFLSIYQYDALILDWNLPDQSGIEVLKRYRDNGGAAPVLILTGKREIEDKEKGLDAGADDYLTKPFNFKEVSARVRALLRRQPLFVGTKLQAGDLALEVDTHKVTRAGELIRLTPLEFAVLELFMRHPNRIFSHDAILDRVWKSDSTASADTVRTCVKLLRKKVQITDKPPFIGTVHGVGYRLELE
jgi:DNA-binding response OmpR family regulator